MYVLNAEDCQLVSGGLWVSGPSGWEGFDSPWMSDVDFKGPKTPKKPPAPTPIHRT